MKKWYLEFSWTTKSASGREKVHGYFKIHILWVLAFIGFMVWLFV